MLLLNTMLLDFNVSYLFEIVMPSRIKPYYENYNHCFYYRGGHNPMPASFDFESSFELSFSWVKTLS